MASKNQHKIQPFGGRFQKRRFSENPYKTSPVRTKIKVRTSKKIKKIVEKSIPRSPPKKHRKKLSKSWFWHQFWAPKPLQNPRKILSKTMFEKEAKKKRKNCPQDPTWETCLSKEREARRHIRVDQACNPKAEDLKVERGGRGGRREGGRRKQAQRSPAQHSTAQVSTAQLSTAQHGSTTQHAQRSVEHSTAQHSTPQHTTAQHTTA